MKYRAAVYRFAWIVFVVLCALVLVCVFLPKYSQYQRLRRRVADKSKSIKKEEADTREFRTKQADFRSNPDFVEHIAREELGLVKPNEFVFRADTPTNAPNSKQD